MENFEKDAAENPLSTTEYHLKDFRYTSMALPGCGENGLRLFDPITAVPMIFCTIQVDSSHSLKIRFVDFNTLMIEHDEGFSLLIKEIKNEIFIKIKT